MRSVVEIESVREDALIVVSELVTNAVMHSGCDPEDTIAVRAVLAGGCLRISVHDPGRSTDAPAIPADDRRRRGGLGLRIVERIARRWGVDRGRGRMVWAELAL
jgi:anti-sigma regulatory factor (Ser/Thr protein kinase)